AFTAKGEEKGKKEAAFSEKGGEAKAEKREYFPQSLSGAGSVWLTAFAERTGGYGQRRIENAVSAYSGKTAFSAYIRCRKRCCNDSG
ncbi:hypothetical protein, partial [Caproicibacterium lactatifermentans]|uniref:hypothetical protein n=1 Tax=Caproicibacterium lactatifermentans TaxID=2666138 RepID=UPI003D915D51